MTIAATHTRTHVAITFADPYLTCDQCQGWVVGWHDPERCGPGCTLPAINLPCEHRAGATSVCPSWSPVDGCRCSAHLGRVEHAEPLAKAVG